MENLPQAAGGRGMVVIYWIMAKKLDDRRQAYVENVSKGIPKDKSAIMAGMSPENVRRLDESYDVQTELKAIREQAAKDAGITRDDVINGFKDAALMAKVLDDVPGMVAAWRELGKLLGFYAPEVKKIEKGINKADLMKAMDSLSDEELLKLSRGRVIEGEARHVDGETPGVPAVQEG